MIWIRTAPFKPKLAPQALYGMLAVAAATLGACDGGGRDDWRPKVAPASTQADAAEAGYVAPPHIRQALKGPAGLVLVGQSAPNANVRLGAPTGEALLARADSAGGWRMTVPPSDRVRLFGLSMTQAGRTVQAEGYVMITPDGIVALLRAGAGAWRLAPGSGSPNILAIDVDPDGGAVVSGMAAPGAGLGVRVDRTPRAVGQAADDGRFSLSLSEALSPGGHDIQVSGEGGEQRIRINVLPPAPLSNGPLRAQREAGGWRIDWLTPGGGVQTTLITSAGTE